MDSVEKFFRAFPAPEKGTSPQQAVDMQRIQLAATQFLQAPRGSSSDPDYDSICRIARAGTSSLFWEFASILSLVALSKRQLLDDDSAKSRQLMYYKWIALGRKDEEYPFSTTSTVGSRTKDRGQCPSHAFLPSDHANHKACANCNKPGATNLCAGCRVTQDSNVIFETRYCDKTCQTAHWQHHKSTCVSRKNIHRAVSILNDLSVLIKEKAYDMNLESVREESGMLTTRDGSLDELAFTGEMAIRSFPRDLTPSDEHFRAVLLSGGCGDAMALYKPLLDKFLLPLCTSVEEVGINPRNVHVPMHHILKEGVQNYVFATHVILRATLGSGDEMAVDLTGGQYGWREPLALWKKWTQHRVTGPIEFSLPYGSTERQMYAFTSLLTSLPRVVGRETQDLLQTMLKDVDANMLRHSVTSVKQLHKLSDREFETLKAESRAVAVSALDLALEELRASARCRLYFDRSWEFCATDSPEQGEALKDVWLAKGTMETMKERRARQQEYRNLWTARCKQHSDVFKRLNMDVA